MNQLHESFSASSSCGWRYECNRRSRGFEWIGKVRDILVFIMCHMQFENGCFVLPQSLRAFAVHLQAAIECAIFFLDCHLKRKKKTFSSNACEIYSFDHDIIGRPHRGLRFAVISNSWLRNALWLFNWNYLQLVSCNFVSVDFLKINI